MINEALGFAEWLKLNEEVDPKIEIYTEFKGTSSNKNPKLRQSYKRVEPFFQGMMNSIKPRLEMVFKKYLPEFEIEHTGTNQYNLKYVVTNSEFKDDEGNDLELDFDSIRPATLSTEGLEFFSAISKVSKKETRSEANSVEVMLNPEFKEVPAEDLERVLFERFKQMWLGDIDPNEFSSELSSIIFSRSVGGAFFNEAELNSFLTNVMLYTLIEMYVDALSEEFIITREEIDVNNLVSDLNETFERFVEKIRANDLTDDDAVELIAFIKRLTFKLRVKSSDLRKIAEKIVADLMTEINKAGLTKKLMDVL